MLDDTERSRTGADKVRVAISTAVDQCNVKKLSISSLQKKCSAMHHIRSSATLPNFSTLGVDGKSLEVVLILTIRK